MNQGIMDETVGALNGQGHLIAHPCSAPPSVPIMTYQDSCQPPRLSLSIPLRSFENHGGSVPLRSARNPLRFSWQAVMFPSTIHHTGRRGKGLGAPPAPGPEKRTRTLGPLPSHRRIVMVLTTENYGDWLVLSVGPGGRAGPAAPVRAMGIQRPESSFLDSGPLDCRGFVLERMFFGSGRTCFLGKRRYSFGTLFHGHGVQRCGDKVKTKKERHQARKL